MRIVIQRVNHASVTVEGETVGAIGKGLMVLVGAQEGDTAEDVTFLAGKIAGMRIFEDEQEKMNLSVKDVGGVYCWFPSLPCWETPGTAGGPAFPTPPGPRTRNRWWIR